MKRQDPAYLRWLEERAAIFAEYGVEASLHPPTPESAFLAGIEEGRRRAAREQQRASTFGPSRVEQMVKQIKQESA